MTSAGPISPARHRPPVQVVAAVVLFCAVNLVGAVQFLVAEGHPVEVLLRLVMVAGYAYGLWQGWRLVRWTLLVLGAIGLVILLRGVLDTPLDVVRTLALAATLVLLLSSPDTWRSGPPAG